MYTLGQPVTITGTAVKYKSVHGRVSYVNGPVPARQNYDNPKHYHQGVIVGSRHVTEGQVHREEYGNEFLPAKGTARRVWLVAFDLYLKPAMCFDHQVAPLQEEP